MIIRGAESNAVRIRPCSSATDGRSGFAKPACVDSRLEPAQAGFATLDGGFNPMSLFERDLFACRQCPDRAKRRIDETHLS